MYPWFVTGFTDGEGCFSISIIRCKERKVGWRILPRFHIGLHQKDKALLEQIQNFFCVGNVDKHGPQSNQFQVQSACKGRFKNNYGSFRYVSSSN